jgi:hypothetical protein
VERKPARRPSFPARYTEQDVALLASVDAGPRRSVRAGGAPR